MLLKATLVVLFLCCYEVLSCPDGWSTHGSSCYHFSHDTETWVEAVTVCQVLGGHLVEIDNDVENQYIVAQAKLLNKQFWIGLSDLQEEGSWLWVNTKEHASYTHWYPGQPDNAASNENCAHLYPQFGFSWNDAICHLLKSYICEKSAKNIDIVG